MMRFGLALLLTCTSAGLLHAQMPFDMSPERPSDMETGPGTPVTPPAAPPPERAGEPVAPPPAVSSDYRRGLLPTGDLLLEGENATRSWAVHLTEAQAAAPARLHLAYNNAVVVAPENSRLELLINDVVVVESPIQSAEGVATLEAEVPADLLRAGRNQVTLRASQRHRTDCTIESTYELWTSIDAEGTYLSMTDPDVRQLSGVEDLRTISADPTGNVKVAIVAPGITRGDIGADIMKLAQAIALYVPLPNLEFVIDSSPTEDQQGAALEVLLGTTAEIQAMGQTLPSAATTGPFAAFAGESDPVPTFLVSGRDRAEWLVALEQLLEPVNREGGRQREALVTEAWRLPNAPMIYGARDLSFGELGVRSEQFSGRVFTTGFQFAVPADFYAKSYGEAQILLDAAYADSILPGSLINVYVNGSIAVSMPLGDRSGGAILEQFPIPVTMRHVQPGLNDVTIVANLITAADQACAAVADTGSDPRFAIFDTSRFVVPDFARIAERPNLAALAGTGYPYGLMRDPVPIFLERYDGAMLSVTADLLARMALSAGRAIPVSFTTSVDATMQRDAMFVGAINAIPPSVLSQVNVAEESRRSWMPAHANAATTRSTSRDDAEVWRRQIEQRSWTSKLEDWLLRTFDLSFDALRFTPAKDTAFVPSQSSTILLAQGGNPSGTGVWTLLAAPDSAMLRDGTSALADIGNWDRVAGRLVTLERDLETMTTLPVTSSRLVETQERSLRNVRLIITNWLSTNILSYSLLLVAACILLGVATSALLSRLGRRQ